MHHPRQIAVTTNQVSGLTMIGVIARLLGDVQRAKGIVIVTVTVPAGSPAEQTTVNMSTQHLVVTVVHENLLLVIVKQVG